VTSEIDSRVRVAVLDHFAATGRAPRTEELPFPAPTLAAAYERLAARHVIVLDDAGELRMAAPFSAVPTPFTTTVGDGPDGPTYHGNCIWDALGIVAMLGGTGTVATPCPDCGEPLTVRVEDHRPQDELLVHFLVPAAHWWDDIGFT
jgi:hypothetical protein